jgi:8-oxo-dGTP pyrophosphatase MutT (NUDIX family)
MPDSLHADAVRLVRAWAPPTAEADAIRRRFLDLLATQPHATRADNAGAHITASAIVVNAELDRVLLCLHGRVDRWLQLGGHCEDGDASLADAALREAAEESGIAGLRLHPEPIDLDVHRVACRHGASHHFDVRFVALAPPGAVETVSAESHALGWFRPDRLPSPLGTATERLVTPALATARLHLAPDTPNRVDHEARRSRMR